MFTNKYYVLNPELILENETHKLLWGFEVQMDNLISAGGPDLLTVNKKKKKKKRTCRIVNFAVSADPRVKLKESENKISAETLLENLKENKLDNESDGDYNCNWGVRYSH